MRPYPLNSPQAAARIVALAMIADGNLTGAELDALVEADSYRQLGMQPDEWHEVVGAFCEDLLSGNPRIMGGDCTINPRTLAALMGEVNDPDLRKKVMDLCVAVADADAELVEEEMIVLRAAGEHWGTQKEAAQPA